MALRCLLWTHTTDVSHDEDGEFVTVCKRCGAKFKGVQVKKTLLVHAPKEKVYEQTVNYDKWPSYLPYIKSTRLVSQEANTRIIECVFVDKKGRTKVRKMIQRLISPDRVEEEHTVRNGIVRAVQTFQEVDGDTEYSVTSYLQYLQISPLTYPILRRPLETLFEKRLKQSMEAMMQPKKKAAESSQ